jgi:hypothetical protein
MINYIFLSVFKNDDISSEAISLITEEDDPGFESSSMRMEYSNDIGDINSPKSIVMNFPNGSGILEFQKKYILHLDISLRNSIEILVYFFIFFFFFLFIFKFMFKFSSFSCGVM